MDTYIPDVILEDYERMAKMRMDRVGKDIGMFVPVHANVLLGLIRTYREARKQHDLQKPT